MINPMIGMPQGAEWLVILAIVVLVFGAAKLPDLARGTGQALRIFKAETKGLKDDEDDTTEGDANPPAPKAEIPPAAPVTPAAPVDPAPSVAPVTPSSEQTDTRNG
ncbi:twin-arginine translocase TatA/TatE family subunit [Nocardioides sp.]|uniref:twin-arginine translocase TatA/TatE family subunit n=1 Tax=Nocardioides sp. TaxID=35761 RepID=UPI00286A8FD0|nr:twin-arginine translocase TatA/TatE family subunit [Nocardioides sp.]